MNQFDNAAASTLYVQRPSAVERMYGSSEGLNAALDALPEATLDVWRHATAIDAPGVTGAAMRHLWSETFDRLGEREREIVALALSDDDSPAREAAREMATQAYMGVARSVSAAHVRHTGDDGRQVALMGMWQGFREYDPTKQTRPMATIQRNILRALSDAHAARFAMSVPEPARIAFSKARQAAEALLVEERASEAATPGLRGHGWLQAGAGVDELAASIAEEHGLSAEGYWQVYRVLFVAEVLPSGEVSLSGEDSFASEGDGTYTQQETVLPLVAPAEANPAQAAMVAALLDKLTGREREVIALRFGLDGQPAHTEDEAAAAMSLTPRRVRQLQAAALATLRSTSSVVDPSAFSDGDAR